MIVPIGARKVFFAVGVSLVVAGLLGPAIFLLLPRLAGGVGLSGWVTGGYALSLMAILFIVFGTGWKRIPFAILAVAEALFWYVMTIGA